MVSKYIYIAALIISTVSADLIPVKEGNKIKLTTGTGAFCGDTVVFITNQLVPTYELYKDFLEIEFIPWGRASLLEDGSVVCNAGSADCWANRVHRCVINSLKDYQDAQVKYMGCEFSRRAAFLEGSYGCVQETGLNLVEVDYCVNNPRLDNLDAAAHDAVAEAMEVINFVPSIVFNDEPDVVLHNTGRFGLHDLICRSLAEVPETGVSGCPA